MLELVGQKSLLTFQPSSKTWSISTIVGCPLSCPFSTWHFSSFYKCCSCCSFQPIFSILEWSLSTCKYFVNRLMSTTWFIRGQWQGWYVARKL